MKVPNPPNGKAFGWLRFAATVSSLCIIPLLLWGVSVEKRVTTIEASRFDDADGAVLLRVITDHLVQQAATDATLAAGLAGTARELEEWKQAIREAVRKMDRYHSQEGS
jgi:hypothetical protein